MNLTRKKKQTELLLLGWYTWFMKERVERLTIASNGITSNFLAALVLGLSEPPLLKVLYRWRPSYVSNDWSTTVMLFIYSYPAYGLLKHMDCYIMTAIISLSSRFLILGLFKCDHLIFSALQFSKMISQDSPGILIAVVWYRQKV